MFGILLQSDGFLIQSEVAEFMNSTNQKVPELKCYQWLCDFVFFR